MRWHLVAPDGSIVRSADAGSIGEARFRLAPIPPHHRVFAPHAPEPPKRKPAHRNRRTYYGSQHWCVNEPRRRAVLAANVEGYSDADIGRALGISPEGVQHHRLILGLPSVNERRDMVVRAYWTLGWQNSRIARRIGSHAPAICNARKRMGLPAHHAAGGFSRSRRAAIIGGDYAV